MTCKEITVKRLDLSRALDFCRATCKDDIQHPFTMFLHLAYKRRVLTVEASDGFRAHRSRVSATGGVASWAKSITIHCGDVANILKAIKRITGDVTLEVSGDKLFVAGRPYDHNPWQAKEYPDISTVFGKLTGPRKTWGVVDLLTKVKLVSALAVKQTGGYPTMRCPVVFAPDGLRYENPDAGRAWIDCETGCPEAIPINRRYLVELLRRIKGTVKVWYDHSASQTSHLRSLRLVNHIGEAVIMPLSK